MNDRPFGKWAPLLMQLRATNCLLLAKLKGMGYGETTFKAYFARREAARNLRGNHRQGTTRT